MEKKLFDDIWDFDADDLMMTCYILLAMIPAGLLVWFIINL